MTNTARSDKEADAEELRALKEKLESKEEQELIKWSVELGRKAKKESFKKLCDGLTISKK